MQTLDVLYTFCYSYGTPKQAPELKSKGRSHWKKHSTIQEKTPEQELYFRKACGVARHAYNWALARWKDYRAAGTWAKMKDLKAEYTYPKAGSRQYDGISEV